MGQKQHKRKARREASSVGRANRRTPAPATVGPLIISGPMVWASLGIAALVAAVYAQVRHFEFVYLDDPVYVVNNAHVQHGLTREGIRWAFTTGDAGNWHPVTWLSHMLDIEIYGSTPGGHHATSVVIHIATSILLLAALYRMTNGLGKSAFVAALFALHPLHVESVAWVSERKDVLSALFWVLTIHAYVSYVRHPNLRQKLLVLVFFALGLMSKPMVVTLPFTLLLLDYWPLKRVQAEMVTRPSAWIPLLREKLPLFALSLFSMVVTVRVQRSYGAVVQLDQLPLGLRVGNSVVAYVEYMRDMIWPTRLAAFYPFHPRSAAAIGAAAIVLVGLTFLVVREARRRPYLLIGWAWFIGTLIPAIGLVQVGDQARADRYTYVPAIGVFIIAAWGVSELVSRWRFAKPALRIASALAVAACAAVSLRQISFWKNDLSLFARAADVTSRNYRAEALLGVALSAKGRHSEAITHYKASLDIWQGNAEVHSNLGASLFATGKTDDAIREFADAVRFKPGTALYHYNLGVMLNEKGRKAEAIEAIRKAIQLDPANGQFAEALAVVSR